MKRFYRNNNFGLFVAVIVLFGILSIFTENFLSGYNIYTISRTLSLYAAIGLAQAVVLVIGNMNLSVGAIGGLATVTTGYIMDILGYSNWVAVIAGLAVGILCGFINGFITAKFGINAFIVTLATTYVFTGINFGLTKGFSFTKIPVSFTILGKGKIFFIPYIFIFVIVVLVIIYIFYNHSIIGRRCLAVGDNIVAAKFSGINTPNIIILSHTLSGFIASLAGILYISRMGAAQPAAGQNWLLIAFAVAILGGTALNGGKITAFGIILGALLMVMIKNGLVILKANIYWEQAFLGSLILLAIGIDRVRSASYKR